jgi:hypothetical protein
MTIRRQYSLPNCTLILEGLSDSPQGAETGDSQPSLSILVNAECRFVGHPKPLNGGRDFLESLVAEVNTYAREFLGGIRIPRNFNGTSPLVRMEAVENDTHRLTIDARAIEGNGSSADEGELIRVDLNTVQLFDLVEAVDQLFADRRTLPDWSHDWTPVSRKKAATGIPLTKRAAPAALGVSGLAVAAIAFFFVPTPEIRRPSEVVPGVASESREERENGENGTTETPTSEASPSSSEPIAQTLEQTPEIDDPNQLEALKWAVYDRVNAAWTSEPTFDRRLVYQVAVGQDGAILGYKPETDAAIEYEQQTPLIDLVYIPTEGNEAEPEAIAMFKVVFQPNGVLQVSPWNGYPSSPEPPPEIEDPQLRSQLQDRLYELVNGAWQTEPEFDRPLEYRVGVSAEGEVAQFEALNDPASIYLQDTPLPSLHQPSAAVAKQNDEVTQVPMVQFRVVFTPGGVLQVSPWEGY